MSDKNTACLRCGDPLSGKQEKYCSERCRKKAANKRWKQKHWRLINAKTKTRKIAKKTRRKVLAEQEIKKRKDLVQDASICQGK